MDTKSGKQQNKEGTSTQEEFENKLKKLREGIHKEVHDLELEGLRSSGVMDLQFHGPGDCHIGRRY